MDQLRRFGLVSVSRVVLISDWRSQRSLGSGRFVPVFLVAQSNPVTRRVGKPRESTAILGVVLTSFPEMALVRRGGHLGACPFLLSLANEQSQL
jgi:hypothetical protein